MRVALDVTASITGSTGVARYATQLTAALRERGVDVAPFAIGRPTYPPPPWARHVRVPLRLVQRSWAAIGRPRPESLVGGADVVHALDLLPPPSRVPVVVTVHDITAIEYPEFHSARPIRAQQTQLETLHRAAVVLTNSQCTADRLCARGVDADRVCVTHFGVTALPDPVPVDVPRPYLLAVGEITRRKGYDVLLRAVADAGIDHVHVVFAGPDGFDAEFCRPLAHRWGVAERTVFLGAVEDAQLAALYDGALALCFPSYAEGFGLPVLEAMARGVPVVASDLPAVREVAGNAASFVPAGDVESWVEALATMVEDGHLRARLADAGGGHAASFTWDATAAATVDAYERALALVV